MGIIMVWKQVKYTKVLEFNTLQIFRFGVKPFTSDTNRLFDFFKKSCQMLNVLWVQRSRQGTDLSSSFQPKFGNFLLYSAILCERFLTKYTRNSCEPYDDYEGELLLHIRCIHTQERPFQCSYCAKNFQRRDLLRKHERIHTDTRPYGCEFCGKTFTARDKMIVHRRLHTGWFK